MIAARPDAVTIPKRLQRGADDNDRMESIVDIAEPLLECTERELAWCRDQVTYFFCTRDPSDTEKYPTLHPTKSQQPRYDWIEATGGIKLGYLKADAETDRVFTPQS